MKEHKSDSKVRRLAIAGLMAALCFVGYTVFPSFSASGTKIHIGNSFVVIAALLLGGPYGGLAGAVGLTIADLVGGFAESAPRTFITKLIIGLVVGLIAHKIAKLSEDHSKKYITAITILASVGGLGVNLAVEPSLKWLWYTILIPNADKTQSAIASLMAITTYSTLINTVVNTVIASVLYLALRPALKKAGLFNGLQPPRKSSK